MTEPVSIEGLGLRAGDHVRFKRAERGRWQEAIVLRREQDGSIGLRDSKGAYRALPLDRLEVRRPSGRARSTRPARWVPAPEWGATPEQLELF